MKNQSISIWHPSIDGTWLHCVQIVEHDDTIKYYTNGIYIFSHKLNS